jgi:glucose-1-phosphate adenylyltransferase
VSNSLLFSNVRVHDYSHVERSVILPRVRVGERCVVQGAVIDSGCVIPDGMKIGVDLEADAERFHVTDGGVVLVTSKMLKRLPSRGD